MLEALLLSRSAHSQPPALERNRVPSTVDIFWFGRLGKGSFKVVGGAQNAMHQISEFLY